MTKTTNPAQILFATTRDPSPLALLDNAPRIGYGVSIIVTVALVVGIIWYGARAMRLAQEAAEKERAASEARHLAALAAIDPGTLAQMEALCEDERAIARAQDFAREVTR